MTQGHNIVADGWAGASNPQPNPNPHPSHTNIHKKYPKRLFFHFSTLSLWTDRWTNRPTEWPTNRLTDGQTDKASYRVTCPQLKRIKFISPLTSVILGYNSNSAFYGANTQPKPFYVYLRLNQSPGSCLGHHVLAIVLQWGETWLQQTTFIILLFINLFNLGVVVY